MARTKIVCTIGPSCDSLETLKSMIAAGMDVARLNFSHGTHETHRRSYERIRQAAEESGEPVSIMQDLSGPKIRIGQFEQGKVFLKPDQDFILYADPVMGTENKVHVGFEGFAQLAREGGRILLADGLIELRVKEVHEREVLTEVTVGGWLSDRKGISFPGSSLPLKAMTEKDYADLDFGLELGVDYVALSFVRSHKDIKRLKKLISEKGAKARTVAKLERPEALEDLEAILDASDAVMVARGDLGIEMEPEKVPMVQKRIIREASVRDVYVITATQMLESMIHNPWPTRAETSDVANAVLDGTDAVMLSGETATGEFPVRAVSMMERIIRYAEGEAERSRYQSVHRYSFPGATGWAASEVAELVSAKVICAFTRSGASARLISKLHPPVEVVGLTPDKKVMHQLNLAWGVRPLSARQVAGADDMIEEVERVLLENGLAEPGDAVVIVAGYPFGEAGTTNLLHLHRMKE